MEDDELLIPTLPITWNKVVTDEDRDILLSLGPAFRFGTDYREAAIMLAFTQLRSIRPTMRPLALYMRHAEWP